MSNKGIEFDQDLFDEVLNDADKESHGNSTGDQFLAEMETLVRGDRDYENLVDDDHDLGNGYHSANDHLRDNSQNFAPEESVAEVRDGFQKQVKAASDPIPRSGTRKARKSSAWLNELTLVERTTKFIECFQRQYSRKNITDAKQLLKEITQTEWHILHFSKSKEDYISMYEPPSQIPYELERTIYHHHPLETVLAKDVRGVDFDLTRNGQYNKAAASASDEFLTELAQKHLDKDSHKSTSEIAQEAVKEIKVKNGRVLQNAHIMHFSFRFRYSFNGAAAVAYVAENVTKRENEIVETKAKLSNASNFFENAGPLLRALIATYYSFLKANNESFSDE